MDEETLAAINDAVSKAVAQALATSSNAASSAGTARTTSNTEHARGSDFVDQQVDSDIGVEEAWAANVKRTYDMHQTYDFHRLSGIGVAELATHQKAENLWIQAAQNALATSDMLAKEAVKHFSNLDKQHLSHRDIATDHLWNNADRTASEALSTEVADDASKD